MKSKNVWIRVLCVFLSIAIMSNSLAKDHHARRQDPRGARSDEQDLGRGVRMHASEAA